MVALADLFIERGPPARIGSDNSSEFARHVCAVLRPPQRERATAPAPRPMRDHTFFRR
jgi:hypothetical protein